MQKTNEHGQKNTYPYLFICSFLYYYIKHDLVQTSSTISHSISFWYHRHLHFLNVFLTLVATKKRLAFTYQKNVHKVRNPAYTGFLTLWTQAIKVISGC